MFGCRGDSEPFSDAKRPFSHYDDMGVFPSLPPATRRSLGKDGPPLLDLTITLSNSVRSSSPTSQFAPSPQSPDFPRMQSPAAARHSPRSSQDTIGGLSMASSGFFDPSSITWPVPPSSANSTTGSPPGTAQTYDTGPIITGRSTPNRYKPMQPAPPSNWKKPQDWQSV